MTRLVLVSGFGPWGGIDENPTALVLDRLKASAGPGLATLLLPVESAAIPAAVGEAFRDHDPILWLGLGLAIGSATIAVERLAANLRDFAEPDAAGVTASGPVVPGGPAAYPATVPVPAIVAALRGHGIPARASTTAGTFLCNQLMYEVLHAAAASGARTRVGFLHVPAHPALVARQTGRAADHPSMDIAMMTEAVRISIAAATDAASPASSAAACLT